MYYYSAVLECTTKLRLSDEVHGLKGVFVYMLYLICDDEVASARAEVQKYAKNAKVCKHLKKYSN